jgi:type I restriction enzyme S subunit
MKSNYKPIGDYIQLVDERNKGLQYTNLLGISVTKQFIPSVANIIGTDMENYKIIRKNQFACSIMQVRRDKKMPVALYISDKPSIISQAYPIFEIKDTTLLLTEYLMMWFTRSEFDRQACFNAVGGVRGSLEWEDFCLMELPIPSIEKQREIVKEYHVIQNRIALNNQLIAKLEETAQTIYKQWFVDFEFPDDNGLPYKSNGGAMEWCAELEKDVPLGWEITNVKDFCKDMKSGGTPSRGNDDFWNKNDIPWVKTGEIKNNIVIKAEEYISKNGLNGSSAKLLPIDTVLMSMYGVNAGEIGILKFEATTNQACCGMICENKEDAAFLYFHFLVNQEFISSQAIGGAQENLSKDFIEKIKLLKPNNNLISQSKLSFIINNKELYTRQNLKLDELSDLVLARMTKVEREIETVEN